MVVWHAILRLYGANLGFGSPNFNLNYSVIILILEPPSNNTSFIVFFPICTWIIAIWLSIATSVVLTSSTKEPTCLSVVVLLTFWVFSSFSFYQIYIFSSKVILSNCLEFKVQFVSNICLPMSKKNSSIMISFPCEFTTSRDFCASTE